MIARNFFPVRAILFLLHVFATILVSLDFSENVRMSYSHLVVRGVGIDAIKSEEQQQIIRYVLWNSRL